MSQGCRTYATQWVSTSTFGNSITSSASFSTTDHAYTENSPAGSTQIVRRDVYGSTADFIEDARILGRFLILRTERCADANSCAGGLAVVETHSYDSQRRRIGVTTQVGGAALIVETYTAWDSQGRPTAGTRAQPGVCAGLPVSLSYDEAARTISITPVGELPGLLCLGVFSSGTQSYDADGNLVSETGSVGGTSTTTTHTVKATTRICG